MKTTALFLPQIVAPSVNGGDGVTTYPGNPIRNELEKLKVQYDLDAYNEENQTLAKKYNIEGFRAEYEALHQRSISNQNDQQGSAR